ncbi:MAG TPA: hypothetical protein VF573_05875 [Paraburkholderia sp.]|uniref:hypothetical protein n=1 Tax=Paraburkholderia sp. TaxID=1926495 RepID=UPI002ED40177
MGEKSAMPLAGFCRQKAFWRGSSAGCVLFGDKGGVRFIRFNKIKRTHGKTEKLCKGGF